MTIILIIFLVLTITLLYLYKRQKSTPASEVYVREVPFGDWAWKLKDCITLRLTKMAHEHNDVKMFKLKAALGLFTGYVINDLGHTREICLKHRSKFIVQQNTHNAVASLLPNAILSFPTHTDEWKSYHTAMSKCFTSKYLENAQERMVACVNRMADKWEREILASPSRSITRDLKQDIEDLSIDIIMNALMGINYDELNGEQGLTEIREASGVFVQEMYNRMTSICGSLFNFLSYFKVSKAMKVLREAAQKSIKQSSATDSHTMVSTLLQEKELKGDKIFSDSAIQDALLILQFGAGETSTAGILDTIRTFAKFTNVRDEMRKALEEGEQNESMSAASPAQEPMTTNANAADNQGAASTVDSILNCTYVNNFTKELLRYYPVVGMTGRVAKEEHIFEDGTRIPAGGIVFIPFHKFHTDPKIWGEDANSFNPNRWNNAKQQSFAFMPFGSGDRQCLGQRLAELELKLVSALLVKKFNFEEAGEMKLSQRISVQPDTLPMKVTLRSDSTTAEGSAC